MTRIDGSASLMALVRSRLSSPAQARSGNAGNAALAAGAGIAPATLSRIGALAAADPDRHRKAVRIYLEAVLVQEFGDGFVATHELPGLLDAVQSQMALDPQLAAAAREAAEHLLARSRPAA